MLSLRSSINMFSAEKPFNNEAPCPWGVSLSGLFLRTTISPGWYLDYGVCKSLLFLSRTWADPCSRGFKIGGANSFLCYFPSDVESTRLCFRAEFL